MKITLSCLTLLVVFFITGIGDAEVTGGQVPSGSNRPPNRRVLHRFAACN